MPYKISMSSKHSVFKEWQPALLKGLGSLDAHITSGKPLPPDMVKWLADHKLILDKREEKLPEIIGWTPHPFFVTGAVRQIIEKLEPDTHHFYEVNSFHKEDGNSVADKYYMLVISQAVKAIDLDRSDTRINHVDKKTIMLKSGEDRKRFIKKKPIHCLHLWSDKQLNKTYFCSDSLHESLEKTQARGWDFHSCTLE